MTNYAVDDFVFRGTIEEVLALLETEIEKYANTKTIYLCEVERTTGSSWIGLLIIATE